MTAAGLQSKKRHLLIVDGGYELQPGLQLCEVRVPLLYIGYSQPPVKRLAHLPPRSHFEPPCYIIDTCKHACHMQNDVNQPSFYTTLAAKPLLMTSQVSQSSVTIRTKSPTPSRETSPVRVVRCVSIGCVEDATTRAGGQWLMSTGTKKR